MKIPVGNAVAYNILMITDPGFIVDLLCSSTETANGTDCTRSTSMLVALCRYDKHTTYAVPHCTECTYSPEPHTHTYHTDWSTITQFDLQHVMIWIHVINCTCAYIPRMYNLVFDIIHVPPPIADWKGVWKWPHIHATGTVQSEEGEWWCLGSISADL